MEGPCPLAAWAVPEGGAFYVTRVDIGPDIVSRARTAVMFERDGEGNLRLVKQEGAVGEQNGANSPNE